MKEYLITILSCIFLVISNGHLCHPLTKVYSCLLPILKSGFLLSFCVSGYLNTGLLCARKMFWPLSYSSSLLFLFVCLVDLVWVWVGYSFVRCMICKYFLPFYVDYIFTLMIKQSTDQQSTDFAMQDLLPVTILQYVKIILMYTF